MMGQRADEVLRQRAGQAALVGHAAGGLPETMVRGRAVWRLCCMSAAAQLAKGCRQALLRPGGMVVRVRVRAERQLAAAPRSLLGLPQLGPHRLRYVLLCFGMF